MLTFKDEKRAKKMYEKPDRENGQVDTLAIKHVLRVGDTVEIVGNIPFQLRNKPKPLLGKIVNIDGAYILVRPKYRRYECEFYSGELRYVC